MKNDMQPAFPVPFDEIYKKNHPYATRYCMINGIHEMMPRDWVDLKSYASSEDVYRACLEKRCTWKELLGFKGYPDNVVL